MTLSDDVVHYTSPLLHEKRIHTVTGLGTYQVIDPTTSLPILTEKLKRYRERTFWLANIALAGGHLYLMDEFGATLVLTPGTNYQEIAYNKFQDLEKMEKEHGNVNEAERFYGSPAFFGDRIFIRGSQYLYCLGQTTHPRSVSSQ